MPAMNAHASPDSRAEHAPRAPYAHFIPGPVNRELVLASTSTDLRQLLMASGLTLRMAPAGHNEMKIPQTMFEGLTQADPADIAELQMRMQVDSASTRFPGALIIGAQQVVALDGRLMETPQTLEAAGDLLFQLRGRTHQRHSAVALAEDGQITWSSVDTTHLTMCELSAQFVGWYLAAAGPQAVGSPGAYQLGGVGLQLFEQVNGDYPAVLGAPLFSLFQRLRQIGFLDS